jgi:hypothetical protein
MDKNENKDYVCILASTMLDKTHFPKKHIHTNNIRSED